MLIGKSFNASLKCTKRGNLPLGNVHLSTPYIAAAIEKISSSLGIGLSFLTKIFTGFLIPIFVFGLVYGEYRKFRGRVSWRKLFLPAIVWGFVSGVFTLGLGLIMVGPENILQLFESHLSAQVYEPYQVEEWFSLSWHLKDSRLLLIIFNTRTA